MTGAALCTAPQRVDRPAELAALQACAQAVLVARNGHHIRWARVGCVRGLLAAGLAPAQAEAAASATLAWAQPFSTRSNALVAAFNTARVTQ